MYSTFAQQIYALGIFITFGKTNFKQLLNSFVYLIMNPNPQSQDFILNIYYRLIFRCMISEDICFSITHK